MSILRTHPLKIAKSMENDPAIDVNVITPKYIRQCDNIAVCTPFITPDLGAMFGELLVERLQCSSISLCYNLHHSKCWFVGGIYKTEHPHKRCWTP